MNDVTVTEVIDAKEKRKVVVIDISNAFVLTEATNLRADFDERVIMMVREVSAEMSVSTCSDTYKDYVACENEVSTIHAWSLRALHGCSKSAMLFCIELAKAMRNKGFIVNPCEPCMANMITEGVEP